MKAVGLFSGGLDSTLACAIMRREGFEVLAVHFFNGFNASVERKLTCGPSGWQWTPDQKLLDAASRLGVTLAAVDVSDEFTDILLHPPHGYGTGANPCIDCHTFFAGKAREIMEREGAAFVFSGEVAGQRPMSQHRPMLKHVEKASGLEGLLLRPLSAKLLDETIPEKQGLVNREHLYGFSGRSRKPQVELAREFGIDFYPQSGGGCLLTEKNFGIRFKDLVNSLPDRDPTMTELNSLKTGRHLRLPGGLRVIVGRNETENDYLTALIGEAGWRFHVADEAAGAEVFALGEPDVKESGLIAAVTARYSKLKNNNQVTVQQQKGTSSFLFTVQPANQNTIDSLMLHV